MCICVYVYMCICVYVYMCICVYVYMCMCVCVYVCMCVCRRTNHMDCWMDGFWPWSDLRWAGPGHPQFFRPRLTSISWYIWAWIWHRFSTHVGHLSIIFTSKLRPSKKHWFLSNFHRKMEPLNHGKFNYYVVLSEKTQKSQVPMLHDLCIRFGCILA